MKRKTLCLILAFCCLTSTGCNRIEKESMTDSTSSTVREDMPSGSSPVSDTRSSSIGIYSSSTDLLSSSGMNDQSSSGTTSSEQISSTTSSDQTANSSSSTNEYRSPNSSVTSSYPSSSSSTDRSTTTKQNSPDSTNSSRPLTTQSSKPQSSKTQSSTSSTSVSQPLVTQSSSSTSNELLPPDNVEIIGNYDQRAPEDWEIEYANEVFRLTNIERVKEGLPEFKHMELLDNAALTRAWEVLVLYDHMRPDGRKFSTALTEAGISWQACGENIAAGQSSPEQVVKAWMNSTGHRANILNPNYEYLSVGFYYDYDQSGGTTYRYFWAQNFCTEL